MTRSRACLLLSAIFATAFLLSACGPRRLTLPSGGGTPFPAFAAAYQDATAACRGVRTIVATVNLSGRAGDTRLRGNVDAGFAAPASVRLEGRAPFGRPVFILVAREDAGATLVLPRDNRVLQEASPAEIVEALTGIALGPAELRAVLAGCGLRAGDPSGGRSHDGGWISVDLGAATGFLRQVDGAWRLIAARSGPLTVEYSEFASNRPSRIRVRREGDGAGDTELSMRLSDVDINVPLEAEAFEVEIPASAVPLTLGELRRAGPLGGSGRAP